ncbi:MAG: IS256 family transposase [Blastocatellia bacterium]
MSKDTGNSKGSATEMGLTLEELIRRGARDVIQRAIEVEVSELLAEYGNVRTLGGQAAVVRNGYLPAREILTPVGGVEVRVPKVRDRSGAGVKFNSALVPPYVRRSKRISAALPWLYLKGISSGDMREALAVLVGEDAKGLSPNVVGRLKAQWAQEYGSWMKRELSSARYVYWWADGIHTGVRAEDDARQCLLVIIGVTAEGNKELVTIGDGLRESTESWLEVLRELKGRGLKAGPLLAVGDGALGFWGALEQIYPDSRAQRCWVHKTANVLNALPKSLHGKAKGALHEIWMAPTRAQALEAFERFVKGYRAKYPGAVEKLTKDREALLAFYDFPAEHWLHLRTTNPIESTFATVRHRTTRTKNCVSRATFLGLAFKLVQEAQKSWRRIRGAERTAELLGGAVFKDGVPTPDNPSERQRIAA